MKKNLFGLLTIIIFLILFSGVCSAITVTATPSPATVNQSVTVTVAAAWSPNIGVNCNIAVNFGDGSPQVVLPTCTLPSCTRITSHTYTAPGVYTITAGSVISECLAPPIVPNPATTAITVGCTQFVITSPGVLQAGTVSQPYTYQLQASGGQAPYSYTILSGSLPPGLSLSASGQISGTPTASGTFNLMIQGTDSCPTGAQTFQSPTSITVNTPSCPAITMTSPPVLPSGQVDQSYNYQIQTTGGQAPVKFSLYSGSLPQGLSLSSSGLISGAPTAAGTYNFVIRAVDNCLAGGQTAQGNFSLTVSCSSLNIVSPSALPAAKVGQPYNYQIQTAGGFSPVTFGVVSGSLPSGLNLNTSGLITGTPTAPGTSNFTLSISDSCPGGIQTVQNSFSITSLALICPVLSLASPPVLPPATVGQAYNYQIQVSGGQAPVTVNLSSGSLPQGLSLSTSGLITGTAATVGTSNFSISVDDSCQARPQPVEGSFSLVVSCTPLNVTSPSVLPAATMGQSYTYQLQASGGQSPVSFAVTSGTLPAGLNLNGAGLISGNPATAGIFNFTITASDSCQSGAQSDQRGVTLTVNSPVLQVAMSPSTFNAARGVSQNTNLMYTLTTPAMMGLTLTSNKGVFSADTSTIGEVNTPLSVTVSGGSGSVSETLNIPIAVIKRAEALDALRIIYTRTFTDGTVSATGQMEILLRTEAGAEFQITRLQLYFENKRAEITVKRNQYPLKAYADIRYTGTGLMSGYWEVDGRVIENVFKHLSYDREITIVSPEIPALPTFDPGTHIVRFVITMPAQDIPLPVGLYFVTAEEYEKTRIINLVSPADSSEVGFSQVSFAWEEVAWADTYLIEFLEPGTEKPVFSAYTKKSGYLVPIQMLHTVFSPDMAYQWKVKGFDAEGEVVGESSVFQFRFF